MCCRSEWQERMYIYKWHAVDQTKHEIFCVHIVCNEIQVKVNLEITTFFFYLRFPYCPNFFWFGVVVQKHLLKHICLDHMCLSSESLSGADFTLSFAVGLSGQTRQTRGWNFILSYSKHCRSDDCCCQTALSKAHTHILSGDDWSLRNL